jgi:undecaprenyl-diphosphatase
MDLSLYQSLNGLAERSDGFEDVMRFLALEAQFLFLALLAALFFARGKWASRNGRHGVAAAGFSALLALGAAQVISHLWERPRPFIAHPNDAHLFITGSHDPSFPSDHATAAFAIAVSIWLRHRRAGWLALGLAALVSVSRVAVGTHYPTDVLGGAVLGTVAAVVLWLPPIRRQLHQLADWAGSLYEHAAAGMARTAGRSGEGLPHDPCHARAGAGVGAAPLRCHMTRAKVPAVRNMKTL